jgi:SAM-dependent methyltransferase
MNLQEKEKYDGIYSHPDKYPRYGHSNHGKPSVHILKKEGAKNIVDLGCGWNEFIKDLRLDPHFSKCVGVDFSCPGADVVSCMTTLPFKDKEFDAATSFDAFEHLSPEQVDKAISEMARVSKKFVVSISYVDSVNRWQGKTLHPTVRSETWWIRKFMQHGAVAVKKYGRFIYGGWSRPLVIPNKASVVLVGNGPSALSSSLGKLIDSFDEVVRFNNYKTESFEASVGSKTTLWSTYFINNDRDDKHHRALCTHETRQPPIPLPEVYRVPSFFFDSVKKYVQDRHRWANGFSDSGSKLLASSGLTVTAFLLDVVGVEQVHLVGFDHFSKKRSGQHHYWEQKVYGKPKEHDGDIESLIFEELRQAKRAEYLT